MYSSNVNYDSYYMVTLELASLIKIKIKIDVQILYE